MCLVGNRGGWWKINDPAIDNYNILHMLISLLILYSRTLFARDQYLREFTTPTFQAHFCV